MIKKLTLISPALLLTLSFGVSRAEAIELIIQENGSGSTSTVETSVEQTTQITQTNDTTVVNDVNVDADTGGNEVNDSSADTTITTGDTQVNVDIDNEVNHTQLETDPCCTGEADAQIIGNGNDSTNSIDLNQTSTTTLNINQTAVITNQITVTANTGNNQATDNQGEVTINTGDIHVSENLINQANTAKIDIGCCNQEDIFAQIKKNGSGSQNSITYGQNDSIILFKNEYAWIENNLHHFLNTGGNSATGNLGPVLITTGDITLDINLKNGPINYNDISICPTCDDNDNPPTPPQPPQPPVNPPTPPVNPPTPPSNGGGGNGGNNSNGSSSSSSSDSGIGGSGQVLGITSGQILPATGGSYLLLLIANAFMFLLGCYLRLYSGRAPAKAYAR